MMCRDITAITVVCNTPDLVRRMYEAFRHFHPHMKVIIIDNSDNGNACQKYLNNICCEQTIVYRFNKNIGHGKGLNYGISKAETPYVLIMDSDTEMLKSPVKEMLRLMKGDVYGVGWITEVGKDGYDFGTWAYHKVPVKYLHPYFALLSVEEFYKYPPFVHHGAPFYKTMLHLHNRNLSHKLVDFPGLTGAPGMCIDWNEEDSEYIKHDFGGTRHQLKREGREEIEWKWEY